jgi:hypothetical protein
MKTFGEFYREKVLSRKDLEERTLPSSSEEVLVEKDLFGWKLRIDGKTAPCRSEVEARFIGIFLEAGLTELMVPRDDDYLREILPELEKMKARLEQVFEHYTQGILDRRTREHLRQKVYAQLIQ